MDKIVLGFAANVNCLILKKTDLIFVQFLQKLLAFGDHFQPFAIQNRNALAANINIAAGFEIVEHLGRCFAIGADAFRQVLVG